MENHIAANPTIAPMIPGTGGVRKARWGRGVSGKSGGVRAIYYHRVAGSSVSMLTIYAKDEQEDLTPGDKAELKKIATQIDVAEKTRRAAEAARDSKDETKGTKGRRRRKR